jgi:predicted Zn-dependent peptidase
MFLTSLIVAAGLAAGDSVPARAAAAAAPSAAAGAVTVHRQPAIPVVAVRLSVLADDPPGYAGAGHLIQHLVYPSLQEQVRRVGGEVFMERNADAIVYTVLGPAAELPYLAGVLRSALRPPAPSPSALLAARYALLEERLAEWETAGSHVRATLRTRLFPDQLSPAGTDASAARLADASLSAVWGEIYRPDRVSIVAVGDVRMEEVAGAFSELPAPPAERLERDAVDSVPDAPLAPAQATQGWLGAGWMADDANAAALLVTSRLLHDRLQRDVPAATVEVEQWWTRDGQALVAVVAAPSAALPAARRSLDGALAALRRDATGARVRAAAVAVRRDMLFYGRTPENMAEIVGQFIDRSGDSASPQRFYDALAAVDEDDVRRVLDLLAERTPVRADVPPQVIRRTR